MSAKVCVETSVISYLTARPARDVVVAARQQITKDWWREEAGAFPLFASELVLAEASAGDTEAASERLAVLRSLPLLEATPTVAQFARTLVSSGTVPPVAADDATHIALAVAHGVDYLLTWNFSAHGQCDHEAPD